MVAKEIRSEAIGARIWVMVVAGPEYRLWIPITRSELLRRMTGIKPNTELYAHSYIGDGSSTRQLVIGSLVERPF